jgi:hypothetical protein
MTTPAPPRSMSLTSRLSRWAGAAMAVLTLVVGGLVAAEPARAEVFPFTDGFESPGLWVQSEAAALTDVQIQLDSRARNNTNNIAILHAPSGPGDDHGPRDGSRSQQPSTLDLMRSRTVRKH